MSTRTAAPEHRADPDPWVAAGIFAGFAVVLVALLVSIWLLGVAP